MGRTLAFSLNKYNFSLYPYIFSFSLSLLFFFYFFFMLKETIRSSFYSSSRKDTDCSLWITSKIQSRISPNHSFVTLFCATKVATR
jgi:hypothetical protein